MNLRSRNFLVVVSLVLLLCVGGAGVAFASPDGDDDSTYNATGATGFGTQYSLLDANVQGATGRPLVAEGPDGSSVSATLTYSDQGDRAIALTRFDAAGGKTSFDVAGTDDLPWFSTGSLDYAVEDLLDLRVLADGSIRVLVRASYSYNGEGHFQGGELWDLYFSKDGEFSPDASNHYSNPTGCDGSIIGIAGIGGPEDSKVDAARLTADGSISALWDCFYGDADNADVWVAHYASDGSGQDAQSQVDGDERPDADYGEDLEYAPANGDVYVLVGRYGGDDSGTPSNPDSDGFGTRQTADGGQSSVYRFAAGTLSREQPEGGSLAVEGLPVDLAVDHQSRPVVWTASEDGDDEQGSEDEPAPATWTISRLTADLGALDVSWGNGGTATVTDPRLLEPYGGETGEDNQKLDYLTVRPDDRVLALGSAYNPFSGPINFGRAQRAAATDDVGAVIVGFTTGGQVDTGFADSGFKEITLDDSSNDASHYFYAVGEPKLQAGDGKILIPHTSAAATFQPLSARAKRIAPQPSSDGTYLGVTRLSAPGQQQPGNTVGGSSGSTASRPTATTPIRPSSIPAQCSRRVISLVRADVRGKRIKLMGLVGSKLYGKKVTIETNPTAVKASAYSRTTTVTASKKTGAFTATVAAPKKSQFKTVRYRAKSGGATSPVLKLPQSLTSRSVKSAKGTITVKGQVKRSVLGKRNKVKIRRLVCGRYRTVGTARPDAAGRYTVTFKASKIRGVSFYRAEVVVQVKPGSKKYAIQYARAIAIRTTSQTG